MEHRKFNADSGQKTRKSQREKNLTFAQNHYVIKIPYKKTSTGNVDSGNSEYNRLVKNAGLYSKNLTKYIKDCTLEPRLRVVEKQPLINEKMLLEIHKVGVNINQMAYKINAKVDEKEIKEFSENLNGFAEIMEEMLRIIRSK